MNPETLFARAADAISKADGLIITAGAGMGVDSGLPDFRGPNGFWGVYPALSEAKIRFEDIANPAAFVKHPRLAWGFYGHRLAMYREVDPGPAFHILFEIARRLRFGAFIYTSNVDGHFQTAGFDPGLIIECHGSIHHLQCLNECMQDIWEAKDFVPEVDAERCQLLNDMPTCNWCGGIARPNILMFGDFHWLDGRAELQRQRFAEWRTKVERPVVVEIGAGMAIPTVRFFGERQGYPLIRINPNEDEVPNASDVGLLMGGTEGMQGIAAALLEREFLGA